MILQSIIRILLSISLLLFFVSCGSMKSGTCEPKYCDYRAGRCRCQLIKLSPVCVRAYNQKKEQVQIIISFRFNLGKSQGMDRISQKGNIYCLEHPEEIGTYNLTLTYKKQVITKEIEVGYINETGDCAKCHVKTADVVVHFN